VTLPPDLERLGALLAGAARRKHAARERRRRVALAGVVGALAFAVLTPGPLGTGLRDVTGVGLAGAGLEPLGCDPPRGATVRLPACDGPMVLYRPYAVR
jgi:hypothetical protein